MKFAFLGNLQGNPEQVTEEEITLITIQLVIAIAFILTTTISTILTYDLYRKKTGQQPLFPDLTADHIDVDNHAIILALILVMLFVNMNYVDIFEAKGKDPTNSKLQVLVTVITLIAGIISFYISYQQASKPFDFSDVANPEV